MSQDFAKLRSRADAGDAPAMTAFGKLLLSTEGPERNIPAGAKYIARAADKGDGEALTQLSVLVAGGIAFQPDWERALDHLQRAAELGWRPAQDELRFLAGREGDSFGALRSNIDIAAWMKTPEPKVVSERPRILTVQGLMSKRECERVIGHARGKLRRAGTYHPATGEEAEIPERSNSKAELQITDIDLPFMLLHVRMSNLLGLPTQCFEPTNVLHYKPGEEFKPHVDYLNKDQPGLAANMSALGQRIVTLLVYLNEDYEGGETHFPRIDYAFKGRTGDALMFGNVNENGAADPMSLHAGLPPRSGEKWLLSQWVRNRHAR